MLPRKRSGPEPSPAVIARSWFLNDTRDEDGELIPVALDHKCWSVADASNGLMELLPPGSHYPVQYPEAGQV
jgi:hypothetical protein